MQAGPGRVAVLDIDAHHGNGTQSIFYHRADVFYGSVHVDPGAGWFPHYLGFADERGTGAGTGANRNIPLAPGSGDQAWLDAVGQLCDDAREHGAEAIVLSLGVDAAAADPESPLQVSADGYRQAGRADRPARPGCRDPGRRLRPGVARRVRAGRADRRAAAAGAARPQAS